MPTGNRRGRSRSGYGYSGYGSYRGRRGRRRRRAILRIALPVLCVLVLGFLIWRYAGMLSSLTIKDRYEADRYQELVVTDSSSDLVQVKAEISAILNDEKSKI